MPRAAADAPTLLLADIGGTNTRVALAAGAVVRTDTIARFRNADHPGLETVLRAYLADHAPDGTGAIDGVCVAAAGPVRDGVAHLTNLDWTIDAGTLTRPSGAGTVAILNDLQAQGHALGHIAADNLIAILPRAETSAAPAAGASRLVIGVGTGFNAAPVHETAAGRVVPPSECGHVNLPIRTEADLRLCHFVETAHGFPAVEDVLSGRGLERVHAWLTAEAGAPAERGAAEIMAAIAAGDDAMAEQAGQVFARILGTAAGNLALIHLPFGGLYLIGGVARAFAPHLGRLGFGAAYRDKGRFAGFMANFPVHVIADDYAALTGCAGYLTATMAAAGR